MFVAGERVFFFSGLETFSFIFSVLALFQGGSSDGPGQPSLQETPETKNSFQKKKAQDQGSTLCSQTGVSEVQPKHSCVSQPSQLIHLEAAFRGSLKSEEPKSPGDESCS